MKELWKKITVCAVLVSIATIWMAGTPPSTNRSSGHYRSITAPYHTQ